MSHQQRIRRRQILREAEGYLDLIMVLSDRFPIRPENRDRLARRALDLLLPLRQTSHRRGQVLMLIGQSLRAMERYNDAIAILEEAAELDPEITRVWLALGWCHKRCGRLDLAIQALEEALAIDGSEGIIHYNLACYWSLASSPKLALAYLARAISIEPDFRDLLPSESDFDPIRQMPDFQALTSIVV